MGHVLMVGDGVVVGGEVCWGLLLWSGYGSTAVVLVRVRVVLVSLLIVSLLIMPLLIVPPLLAGFVLIGGVLTVSGLLVSLGVVRCCRARG